MFNEAIIGFSRFLRQHLSEISFGITAVTLVMAGPYLNGTLKKATQALHWSIRYLLYVVLCTVGYTLITKFMYSSIRHWLATQRGLELVLWVSGIFLVLAWLAKQQKEI